MKFDIHRLLQIPIFQNIITVSIVDLEANDNISMKVSELNTPDQEKDNIIPSVKINENEIDDEEFSAEIEDVEEENIGDIRK